MRTLANCIAFMWIVVSAISICLIPIFCRWLAVEGPYEFLLIYEDYPGRRPHHAPEMPLVISAVCSMAMFVASGTFAFLCLVENRKD